MGKDKPWMKLYCETWIGDPHLRCCSATDRGVLIDCMALAHFGTPYGFLSNGGKALTDLEIIRALRIPWQTWRKSKGSLLDAGRLGFSEDTQTFYVPRMVRDGRASEIGKMNGAKGGNPALTASAKEFRFAEEVEWFRKHAKKWVGTTPGFWAAKVIAERVSEIQEEMGKKEMKNLREVIEYGMQKGGL